MSKKLKKCLFTHYLCIVEIILHKIIRIRRCGGLVVRVSASRSPVLGSNLGLGPPHSVV